MGVESDYFEKHHTIRKRQFDEIEERAEIQSTNDMFYSISSLKTKLERLMAFENIFS